jgi:hypothetical protein
MTGQATVIFFRRQVSGLGLELLLDVLVAAGTERSRRGEEERLRGAAVRLMTGDARAHGRRLVRGATERGGDLDIVAVGAQDTVRLYQQAGRLRGVGNVARIAVPALEGGMLREGCHQIQCVLMASPAQRLARGSQQLAAARMREVAGGASADRGRRVHHRQPRPGSYSRMALAAELVLARGEQRRLSTAVGIVAVDAVAGGWRMDNRVTRPLRVLVTLDTELSRFGDEQRRMLATVTAVTAGALLGSGVGLRQRECVPDVVVAGGAQLPLACHEKRTLIAGMRVMTVETGAFCHRIVDRPRRGLWRQIVATQADLGPLGRGRDRALLVAGAAIELRMDGASQQAGTGGGVRSVAGRAVATSNREISVICRKPAAAAFMAGPAQRLQRLLEERCLRSTVGQVAGRAFAGERFVTHPAGESRSSMTALAELLLRCLENRGVVGPVGAVTGGAVPHVGMEVSGVEAQGVGLVTSIAEIRLVLLQAQGPYQPVRLVTGGAVAARERCV